MNTSIKDCFVVVFIAFLAGLAAFLLSLLNVLTYEFILNVMSLIFVAAVVLYAVFFPALVNTEKSRVVREAVCCCGKVAIIGFIGTLIFAPITLLLNSATIKVLFDLALGFTFLFLTMIAGGMGCILTVIYQCTRNNCQ